MSAALQRTNAGGITIWCYIEYGEVLARSTQRDIAALENTPQDNAPQDLSECDWDLGGLLRQWPKQCRERMVLIVNGADSV